MDRLERIHMIDQLLTGNRAVSTSRLCEKLSVSLATLKRDLEYMKDRLNAPIIWDREAEGYRFDRAALVGPKYELPGLWFNDSEMHALLATQQLLEDIQPGLLGHTSNRCIRSLKPSWLPWTAPRLKSGNGYVSWPHAGGACLLSISRRLPAPRSNGAKSRSPISAEPRGNEPNA